MVFRRWASALAMLLVACGVPATGDGAAQAAEVRVIAANALKDGLAELFSSFQAETGNAVKVTWAGTVNTARRIGDGEIHDLVIIGSDAIDQLIAAGKLQQGSRIDFARTGIAVAVRAGLPKPDIATREAVRAAIRDAKSLAYSAGPSGAHIGRLLADMGLAEEVAAKVKQPSSGAEVAAILSRGEADLGFAQVSEFIGVSGLQSLGPLPSEIQHYTIYAIGLHAASPAPELAKALIMHLKARSALPAIQRMGMEPS